MIVSLKLGWQRDHDTHVILTDVYVLQGVYITMKQYKLFNSIIVCRESHQNVII